MVKSVIRRSPSQVWSYYDPEKELTIIRSWSEVQRGCPLPPIHYYYWNHRHELCTAHGPILKESEIVILKDLRSEILSIIHSGHMGVEKCLNRERDVILWPKMSADISELVLSCPICLEFRNSNLKEPIQRHGIPDWQVVASDLSSLNGQDYLVVVDYFSLFFESERLHSTTSSTIMAKLKWIFARFGILEKVCL